MKTALLVIDFINDIVSTEGKIASCAKYVNEQSVIRKANSAIEYARITNWLVIPIKVGFSQDYREQPKNSPIFGKASDIKALMLGRWGTEFHSDLAITSSDPVIVKHRVSPFHGTSLELILKNNGIRRLVVCGVSTAWAIQAVVREGHDRDFAMVILEDACAASNIEEHHNALQQLTRIATTISTNEISKLNE